MTETETKPSRGGGGEFGGTEIHERFSYPQRECPDEAAALFPDEEQVVHECDLPKDHTSRHLCGVCGLRFGEEDGAEG